MYADIKDIISLNFSVPSLFISLKHFITGWPLLVSDLSHPPGRLTFGVWRFWFFSLSWSIPGMSNLRFQVSSILGDILAGIKTPVLIHK